MSKISNMINNTYGRLTIQGRDTNRSDHLVCLCSCGTQKSINAGSIRRGDTTSCGCLNIEKLKARIPDRVGSRFGHLVIDSRCSEIDEETAYLCFCDCGGQKEVRYQSLRKGWTKSCGCMSHVWTASKRAKNLVGLRFGLLTAVSRLAKIRTPTRYLCTCDCGESTEVLGTELISGGTRSCGCLQRRTGPDNPRWRGIYEEERNRMFNGTKYQSWKRRVKNRDKHACVCCLKKDVVFDIHHKDSYSWCKERRFDDTNGVTLCKDCHIKFHSRYGQKNNTEVQFEEFYSRCCFERVST